MPSDDLFPVEESLSPKLAWLRAHGLSVMRLENGKYICVLDEDNLGTGATDEEACVDFCIKHRLAHWSGKA